MKLLVAFLVLSVLGLTSASPQYGHRYSQLTSKLLDTHQTVDEENIDSLRGNSEVQELTAAAQLDPAVTKLVLKLITDLGIPLAKAGLKVGLEGGYQLSKLIIRAINCGLCGKCTEIEEVSNQEYADTEKIAKLMAFVEVMESVDSAKQKLDKVKVDLMKDNRVAEAEFVKWASRAIKKAISKLRGATKFIKNTAKKVLCE